MSPNWEKARHPRCRGFEPVLADEEGSQRETEVHVIRWPQHYLGIQIGIGSHLSASLRLASDMPNGRKRPPASVLAIRFHRDQKANRATGKTSRCRTQSQGSGGRSDIAEPALKASSPIDMGSRLHASHGSLGSFEFLLAQDTGASALSPSPSRSSYVTHKTI